jgi:D-inositol-3-phosphate glycosyltransferase
MKKSPLTIAMLCIHSSPTGDLGTRDTGGMSVYVSELARELGRRGNRVDIYTQARAAQARVREIGNNVRLVHLSIGNAGQVPKEALYPHLVYFYEALEAFRAHQHIRYDVIHSHYWLSGCLGLLAQKHWQIPHVTMFHTLGAVKNSTGVGAPESELRLTVERQLAGQCTSIIVGAQREKQHLMRYYQAPERRIEVIPCGVNLDRFQPCARKTARHELGFLPEEKLVLYVGRFDPLKGLDRLLAAIACLRHEPRLRLVVVGGDDRQKPEALRLRSMAEKLGVYDKVTFAGRVDQEKLPLYYSAADVTVIPSYYESFGLVVLESLACGTPVVATPVGDMEHILSEPGLGLVVKDPSARSLAGGIERFFQDGCRQQVKPDIIRSAVLAYGWPSVASAMLNKYREVIRSNRCGNSRIAARRYINPPSYAGAMHQPLFFS